MYAADSAPTPNVITFRQRVQLLAEVARRMRPPAPPARPAHRKAPPPRSPSAAWSKYHGSATEPCTLLRNRVVARRNIACGKQRRQRHSFPGWGCRPRRTTTSPLWSRSPSCYRHQATPPLNHHRPSFHVSGSTARIVDPAVSPARPASPSAPLPPDQHIRPRPQT